MNGCPFLAPLIVPDCLPLPHSTITILKAILQYSLIKNPV